MHCKRRLRILVTVTMLTDEFEWDDIKAATNLEKHNVAFEDATFAFDDQDAIDDVDESGRHDEVRYKLTGQSGQRLLVVIYTERANRKRIISARKADTNEHLRYEMR